MTASADTAALLESMPTKLFLANPDLPENVKHIFRLNDTEMDRDSRPDSPSASSTSGVPTSPPSSPSTSIPRATGSTPPTRADAAKRARAVEEHGLERALTVLSNGDLVP